MKNLWSWVRLGSELFFAFLPIKKIVNRHKLVFGPVTLGFTPTPTLLLDNLGGRDKTKQGPTTTLSHNKIDTPTNSWVSFLFVIWHSFVVPFSDIYVVGHVEMLRRTRRWPGKVNGVFPQLPHFLGFDDPIHRFYPERSFLRSHPLWTNESRLCSLDKPILEFAQNVLALPIQKKHSQTLSTSGLSAHVCVCHVIQQSISKKKDPRANTGHSK